MLLKMPIKISNFSANLKYFSCEIFSMLHRNIMREFFSTPPVVVNAMDLYISEYAYFIWILMSHSNLWFLLFSSFWSHSLLMSIMDILKHIYMHLLFKQLFYIVIRSKISKCTFDDVERFYFLPRRVIMVNLLQKPLAKYERISRATARHKRTVPYLFQIKRITFVILSFLLKKKFHSKIQKIPK